MVLEIELKSATEEDVELINCALDSHTNPTSDAGWQHTPWSSHPATSSRPGVYYAQVQVPNAEDALLRALIHYLRGVTSEGLVIETRRGVLPALSQN